MEMSSNFVFLEHLIDHKVRSEVHHPPLRTGWLMNLLKVDGGDQWINKTNTSSSLQKLWHLPRTSIRYPIESMHRMYGIYQQNWVFCFFVFGVFQHSPSLARTYESRKMHQQKMGKPHFCFVFFSWHGHGWLASRPPKSLIYWHHVRASGRRTWQFEKIWVSKKLLTNKELHSLRIHVWYTWYNVGISMRISKSIYVYI